MSIFKLALLGIVGYFGYSYWKSKQENTITPNNSGQTPASIPPVNTVTDEIKALQKEYDDFYKTIPKECSMVGVKFPDYCVTAMQKLAELEKNLIDASNRAIANPSQDQAALDKIKADKELLKANGFNGVQSLSNKFI